MPMRIARHRLGVKWDGADGGMGRCGGRAKRGR